VIRQRTRSDHRYPDMGQEMSWRLNWEHTNLLTEGARSERTYDIAEISRDRAESIMAGLAHRYSPPMPPNSPGSPAPTPPELNTPGPGACPGPLRPGPRPRRAATGCAAVTMTWAIC
jgi:hypothetical protein